MNVIESPAADTDAQLLSEQFGAPREVDIRLSQEAVTFYQANDLEKQLQTAINLTRRCFPSLVSLSAVAERDPDSNEKWIALVVTLTGSAGDVVSAYNNYSAEWVASVPSPQRYMIRLSFKIT
jgi:hypothetical protein